MSPIPFGKSRRRAPRPRSGQAGTTLVVVMLLLLVSMIAGVAGVRSANLEERMAGHTRDRQVAFQLAEAALRDAERMIATNVNGPFIPLRPVNFKDDCSAGLCRSAPDAPRWSTFTEADWAGPKTWAYGAATGAAAPAGGGALPRFAVEYQGTTQPIEPGKPCIAMFLLVARARGNSLSTDVVLQSVYRHRVGECYAAV